MADVIWRAFGDVDSYVEPFAGSLAVLLERPSWHGWATAAETVNDADAYLANLWRAIAAEPEEVAKWADWPVNETDLFSRHLWLVNEGRDRIAHLEDDPDYFDAKVAGWWLWGICSWIGSGWCTGNGPHWRQLPHLGDAGRGVNRQLPHLGDVGRGAVNGQDMTAGGSGAPRATWDRILWREGEPLVYGYMRALQARLRRVRVCCGDWARVVTPGALAYGATVAVFLDPPYDEEVRTRGLYATEGGSLSASVREWALRAADSDQRLRIALCGYEGEHVMPPSWRVHAWSSTGAYQAQSTNQNRHRERIWFSPSCACSDRQGLLPEVA